MVMTLPRQILPNTTYLITRRCTQRQFLLHPSPEITQIFSYCLAVAANRTGIVLHSVTVLSNHWHAVVTDPQARVPEFLAYLHKYVAKAINTKMRRGENLWSSEKPSIVTLGDGEDVAGKIVYTACNPVAAGLVAKTIHWPGLLAFFPGKKVTTERPTVFFNKDGDMPESASFTIQKPPQWAALSDGNWQKRIQQQVEDQEQLIAERMERENQSFLGKDAVMKQQPTDTPRRIETRRTLDPKIAAKNKWLRIEALQRLQSFIQSYKDAFKRWRDGETNVIFPAGTYHLRHYAKVSCEAG